MFSWTLCGHHTHPFVKYLCIKTQPSTICHIFILLLTENNSGFLCKGKTPEPYINGFTYADAVYDNERSDLTLGEFQYLWVQLVTDMEKLTFEVTINSISFIH